MTVLNAVEPVLKPAPPVFGSDTRRFDLPDMDRHATWFMPRFMANYPHLNERQAIGFLRSVLYNNEFCFLFQEKGAALAQCIGSHALEANTVIWERFVWVEDPANPRQTDAAGFFYDRFAAWAKQKQVSTLVVEQKTDVPHETIKQHLGRILSVEQKVATIKV